ncbi:MAG: hypothetical protein AAB383_04080 [Patescibacteria group bacterium]
MALESYEQVLDALEKQDIDALVTLKPDELRALAKDKGTLERLGDVDAARRLLATAVFYSYTNSQLDKTGVPQVVRENLNWKFDWSTVAYDAAAGNI